MRSFPYLPNAPQNVGLQLSDEVRTKNEPRLAVPSCHAGDIR